MLRKIADTIFKNNAMFNILCEVFTLSPTSTTDYLSRFNTVERVNASYHHAGYSDTCDESRTPRTGKRRVNSYLIDYQKWRNWKQQTAEWGNCYRGFKSYYHKPATTVSSLCGLLCSILPHLIDNQITVHSSLTCSWCSTRVPCVRIPCVVIVQTKLHTRIHWIISLEDARESMIIHIKLPNLVAFYKWY